MKISKGLGFPVVALPGVGYMYMPAKGEDEHVHQVGAGKSLHFRKGGAQIMRQSLDLHWQFLDDIGNELWGGANG